MAERAGKALNNPNADGISIQGSFHNAIGKGKTITLFSPDSPDGKVEVPYPDNVPDGQSGYFIYDETTEGSGCKGFVAYSVRLDATTLRTLLIAWSAKFDQTNLAYCDIYDDNNVPPPDVVYKKMEEGGSSEWVARKLGLRVTSKIDPGNTLKYVAEFTRHPEEAMKKSADQDA